MLVFISDLHISDGSVANFNLPARAFTGVFEDLAQHAKKADAKKLQFVLLGDVFDLIETQHWLGVPADDHPWGATPSEEAALEGLRKVIRHNQGIFDLFQGGLKRHFPDIAEVTVTYVPGNHDRPVNLYPSLRQEAITALGLDHPNPDEPFLWHFYDVEHRTFARHGHEYDAWNYTGGRDLEPDAHLGTPIGDVLTSLLVVKLLPAVAEALQHLLTPEEISQITENLGEMFDVRPMDALIAYLANHVSSMDDPQVRSAIDLAIRRTAEEFAQVDFVRRWLRGPLTFQRFIIKALLFVLAHSSVMTLGKYRRLVKWLASFNPSSATDKYTEPALRALRRLRQREASRGVRYILYGHTHAPRQVPLSAPAGGVGEQCFYLNTGTWRPAYDETADESGFVGSKGLTYTIIYSPEENRESAQPPFVEAWTGMLKDDDL